MQAVTKSCVAASGLYCGLGMNVPIAPTIIAIIAVIFVRILVWTKTQSWLWNGAVCGLAMLAAFATIEGSEINVFRGFWIGVGYGAIGVSIIEIGKGVMFKALGGRLTDAAAVLFNMKTKGEK